MSPRQDANFFALETGISTFHMPGPKVPSYLSRSNLSYPESGKNHELFSLNGEMVPKGKACLCVEYFCRGADDLLNLSKEQLRELALGECSVSKLIDPQKCFDHMVLKLPGADAATNFRDWVNPARLRSA